MTKIESLDLYVRETKPARFASALGKKGQQGGKVERVTSPLCHLKLKLSGADGERVFGCSADRLSVRWLDKRPGRSKGLKLRELVRLIETARSIHLKNSEFETPFEQWRKCHETIMAQGRKQGQELLTCTYVSALFERAIIDGFCRLHKKPFFQMLGERRLGLDLSSIHPELERLERGPVLRNLPKWQVFVRHTIGLLDPLTLDDLAAEQRPNVGLPETFEDYIRREGVRYFKVKISGDVDADLKRLAKIWELVSTAPQPSLTLDANEAYDDLDLFASFVRRLEKEQLGLFQHILFIEQPLSRKIALQESAAKQIRKIGEIKPLVIDESDGFVGAYRRAHELGYAGVSHKNCKGVFKSLLNHGLTMHYSLSGEPAMMSGEDLQNLPIVPLQQDLVTVGVLGLDHCERNGHHYNYGLSMLSDKDKESATRNHPDLYVKRGDEWFLRIRNGQLSFSSLHKKGFGGMDEPDWESMTPLRNWVDQRYPA
jgi:hypothetical protein